MKHTLRKVLTSKYFIVSVTAGLLYTLTGFLIAPWVLQWYAPRYAQQNLHCRADIDGIRINPFFLTLEVDRFNLRQDDELPLVAFEKLFVDLETSSLFHWAFVLREVRLEKPDIHMVVEPDGSLNLTRLVSPVPPAEAAKPETTPLPFILHNAAIQDGRIAIVDKRQSTPADVTLQGLDLRLQDISTLKDHHGTYHLAAVTEIGESMQLEGQLSLVPLLLQGRLSLNAIHIASLWEFVRDSTNLEQPEGLINMVTQYHAGADNTPVQMTLEGLHLFTSDLSLKLLNTDVPFLQWKKLDLEAPRFNLREKELHIKNLLVEDGAIDARIDDSGDMNLQRIIRAPLPEGRQEEGSQPQPAPEASFKVQAEAIDGKNIALHLSDESRQTPIKAAIAGGDVHLRASLELGGNANSIQLQGITSELRGITIHGSSSPEPLFATEKLTIEDGGCDIGAQSLTFAHIAMRHGHLNAGRNAEGKINWQELLKTKESARKTDTPVSSADTPSAWNFLLKSFELEAFKVQFTDLTTHSERPVLSLQAVNAELGNIDGKSPMDFAVRFQMEQGGTAAVSGRVNPAAASVEAELTMNGVVLTSLQPYLEPYVTLQLQSAAASAQGRLRYGIPGDKQKAAFEGNFSLGKLLLVNSGSQKPYLSWNDLQLSTCRLTLEPNRFEAREISISEPTGELIIEKDKSLNLAKVLKNQSGGQKAKTPSRPSPQKQRAESKKEDFSYHVSKIQVKNGNLVFADFSLLPSFKTRIHGLKGTVTGLSSATKTQAKVQMNGHVDKYGTAKISGAIRPADFAGLSDINMVFRNLEMKNLSPYSGRFAGRLIQSGKFSADLHYTLHDYQMTGDNRILIDNLTLGEQVDNPDATNLPLNLAIALLKDGNDRIDIGLPVTGDLNDPQFSLGPLMWKMFTNLIIKTATAPFQALGGLLGGSPENFDAVQFDPGSADLPPPEKEKLLKLADALKSRPQLNLVIQGRYSPDTDGLELRERSLRRTVYSLNANAQASKKKPGTQTGPDDNPDPLDFGDPRTQDTLEKLYKERFGKEALNELEKGLETGAIKPRAAMGNQGKKSTNAGMFSRMADSLQLYKIVPGVKSHEQAVVWAGELYARLAETEKIADKTFLELADARARSIADYLEAEARIPKDRLDIKPPEPLVEDESPSVSLSLDAR